MSANRKNIGRQFRPTPPKKKPSGMPVLLAFFATALVNAYAITAGWYR